MGKVLGVLSLFVVVLAIFIATIELSPSPLTHKVPLGPFIGHTTFHSTTIWARVPDEATRELYRDSVGVLKSISIRERDSGEVLANLSITLPDWSSAPTPFSPSDGVVVFRIDHLPSSKLLELEMNFGPAGKKQASFTTFPTSATKTSFLVGSCRAPDTWSWLGRWSGGNGDRVFQTILQMEGLGDKNKPKNPPSFMLMIGDQIYSDLNSLPYPVLPKNKANLNFYLEKYRQAFGSPGLSTLMSSIPTYMILDDHDIINDWPGATSLLDRQTKPDSAYVLNGAKQAYLTYQYIHNPVGFLPQAPPFSTSYGGSLDYSFHVSSFVRVFVLDVRVERDISKKQIISENQMNRLIKWLRRENNHDREFNGISVIVSSLVFSPDVVLGKKRNYNKDTFAMFPEQQAQIMNEIETETLRSFSSASSPLRVLFLSGDIHASSWSSLIKNVSYSSSSPSLTITKQLRVFTVISSPLAWGSFPYFFSRLFIVPLHSYLLRLYPEFAAGREYNWTVGERSSSIAFTSNYVRVDVETVDSVIVRCRNAEGSLVGFQEQKLSWGY